MWLFILVIAARSSDLLNIYQVADVHVDPLYREGTDPNCPHMGSCCREFNKGQKEKAGKYGHFGNGKCGIPLITLQGIIDFVNKKSNELGFGNDFVVAYSGDQSGQDIDTQTLEENLDILSKVYNMFHSGFEVNVYPSIGNHDTYPIDLMDITSPFLPADMKNWGKWLDEEQLQNVLKNGYYTKVIEKGFRIISLNTEWNSNKNLYNLVNVDKRKEMLGWLEDLLENAKNQSEKVLMIGHVPPGLCGSPGCVSYNFPEYENNFGKLLQKHSDVIITHLVGHEHVQRFGIVTSPDNSNGSIPYFASGSMLNAHGESCFNFVNPSVALYQFNRSNGYDLVDVTVFYNNLTLSNQLLDFSKAWDVLFSYRSDYQMNNGLKTDDFRDLLERFEEEDELFSKFLENYTAKYFNDGCSCDEDCKRYLICQMRYSNHDQFNECYKS